MPAERRETIVSVIVLAGVSVVAILAVPRLLHTTVPSGPGDASVRATDYFSSGALRSARGFSLFISINALLAQLALLGVMVAFAARGARLMRESAAGRIGTGFLLGMLGFAFVWMAQLPFGAAELWWQRRHHLSHVGYLSWAIGNWLGLGGRFLYITIALLIVMGLAGLFRRLWWIPAAVVFVAIATLSTFLSPYLAGDLKPLKDPTLRAQAARIARAEHVASARVSVEDVHTFTSTPNAEATGLGPSRRVILWDTLFDGHFTGAEIRAVLAHEYGHLAREHLLKRLGWDALFALPFAFLVACATRRRGGMYEPAAVPVALLALVVITLALTPVRAAITRRMETEADWISLQTTRDPAASRALFRHLAVVSKDDPRPPGWSDALFGDHPPILRRIAQTLAWQARQVTPAGAPPHASPSKR